MDTVSVVIPTLNAANRIGKLLDVLQSQTLKPDELYVVDSASDDGTASIAREHGAIVKEVDRADFNHGLTRHMAVLETRGDFICFLTDDAIPASEDYLSNLLAPFEDPHVALVSGRQLPKEDARRFEQLVREFNYGPVSNVRMIEDLPQHGIKTYFATDVCSAYRRISYLERGGFGACDMSEDMLMAARFINAGYKVAYAANAEVYHSHNLSVKQQYLRNKAIGQFLQTHVGELAGAEELGEGANLAAAVAKQLIKEGNVPELFAFGLDCIARFTGNRAGRYHAKRLANAEHRAEASNSFNESISVCMATYNGEKYLTEQLDSILASLRNGDEIVVSDDGSTDGTLSILESYAKNHPSIRIIEGPKSGIIKNFENAIKYAKGSIIFLSDQDDVWHPNKIGRVLSEFRDPTCQVVVHNAELIDSNSVYQGQTLFELRGSRSGLAKNLARNSFVGCCMAFRSSLCDFALPIPSDVEMHDWWIGLVAETVGETRFIDEILIDYRRHEDNASPMNHHPIGKMVGNRLALSKELIARRGVVRHAR